MNARSRLWMVQQGLPGWLERAGLSETADRFRYSARSGVLASCRHTQAELTARMRQQYIWDSFDDLERRRWLVNMVNSLVDWGERSADETLDAIDFSLRVSVMSCAWLWAFHSAARASKSPRPTPTAADVTAAFDAHVRPYVVEFAESLRLVATPTQL